MYREQKVTPGLYFIKLVGSSKVLQLDRAYDNFTQMKQDIQQEWGIPVAQQVLLYAGRRVQDDVAPHLYGNEGTFNLKVVAPTSYDYDYDSYSYDEPAKIYSQWKADQALPKSDIGKAVVDLKRAIGYGNNPEDQCTALGRWGTGVKIMGKRVIDGSSVLHDDDRRYICKYCGIPWSSNPKAYGNYKCDLYKSK